MNFVLLGYFSLRLKARLAKFYESRIWMVLLVVTLSIRRGNKAT